MNDDVNYQTDKLAIIEKSQERASQAIALIENCSLSKPIEFLVANLDNKKIKNRTTEPDIKMTLGLMMVKLSALAGIKNEMDYITGQDISKMIFTAYSDLSVEEIWKAFELERYGLYQKLCPTTKALIQDKTNHYQQFDTDYISSVLFKYRNWKQEMRQTYNIAKKEIAAPTGPADDEKRKIMDQAIIRVFEEYKENKVVPTPCFHVFMEMHQRKMFPADTNFDLYYSSAQRDLKVDLTKKKISSTDQTQVKSIKSEIEEISSPTSQKVYTTAAAYVLQDYFNNLIEEEIDIKTLVNESK